MFFLYSKQFPGTEADPKAFLPLKPLDSGPELGRYRTRPAWLGQAKDDSRSAPANWAKSTHAHTRIRENDWRD
ncbi:hypothetical protein CDV55_100433 [Aspergillus turcosus]|nr:hypothetical protein CDV55_100433 [Aspergillus turcosus]